MGVDPERKGKSGPVIVVKKGEHRGTPGMWSYACDCIRCRWEQWWNEADPSSIPMPDAPHPDGEYQGYWDARDFWNSHGHHPRG